LSFQVKSFVSIVASMLNHMRSVQDKVTDFNVGSVARTMVEAPAIEIDELYQQMFHGLKEAIPAAIYTSFSFDRIPAKPSNGLIRVTLTSSPSIRVIPAGTVFSSSLLPVKFASNADVSVSAGASFVDVYVVAQSTGAASNMLAGIAFSVTPSPAGFVSATNQTAFTNGSNIENDDQRKWRFASFIASLNHGTAAALLYGLKTVEIKNSGGMVTEYVKLASVYEPYKFDALQPIAWVRCFIHNGTTGASSPLLARAADVINGYYDDTGAPVSGWKAAGVQVDVEVAANVTVNVTATLTASPGYSSVALIASVTNAIQAYLFGLDIGVSALKAEIIAAAMGVEGVYNFVLTVPAGDTAATYSQKIIPGTISIT